MTGLVFYRTGAFGQPMKSETIQADRIETKKLVIVNPTNLKPTATITSESESPGYYDVLVIYGGGGHPVGADGRFETTKLVVYLANFFPQISSHQVRYPSGRNEPQHERQVDATLEDVARMIADAERRMAEKPRP
jgi:hypothetical protein